MIFEFSALFASFSLAISVITGVRKRSSPRENENSFNSSEDRRLEREQQQRQQKISRTVFTILFLVIVVVSVSVFCSLDYIDIYYEKWLSFINVASKEKECPELKVGLYGHLINKAENDLFPITTKSEMTQKFFNQAIVLAYAYNRIEAKLNFKMALKYDENCVMCHWGITYSNGPELNKYNISEAEASEGYAHIKKAKELIKNGSQDIANSLERSLVNALSHRYPAVPVDDYTPFYEAYSEQMRILYEANTEDNNVAVFYAESLMTLSPWNFWSKDGSKPFSVWGHPEKTTGIPLALLRKVLFSVKEKGLDVKHYNVLGLHLFIHLLESRHPGRSPEHAGEAEFAADALSKLNISTGHLIHMAGHLYLRVGRFKDVVLITKRALSVDSLYVKNCRVAYGTSHNKAMGLYGAMMSAQKDYATSLATDVKTSQTYIKITNGYWPSPEPLVFARFGEWEKLVGLTKIIDIKTVNSWHPYLQAIWYYSTGLAFCAINNEKNCKEKFLFLNTAVNNIAYDDPTTVIPGLSARSYPIFSSKSFAWPQQQTLGKIMTHTLQARILLTENRLKEDVEKQEKAVLEMKKAVTLQDSLQYFEPETWYIPLRECLGTVYLELKEGRLAEEIFKEDLQVHLNNGWALTGLKKALNLQNNHTIDKFLDEQIAKAFSEKVKDFEIKTSCFELFLG